MPINHFVNGANLELKNDDPEVDEKRLNVEALKEIFSDDKHIEFCLVLLMELGAVDSEVTRCNLTERKGYPVFAVIDATRPWCTRKFTDNELLRAFNSCLGTDFKQIKRSNNRKKYKRYDEAYEAAQEIITQLHNLP